MMAFERLENKRYPSLCAHRGLSGLCPEGTLPAFGAAIAMGAREIEFDLRLTRDQQLVISHDPDLSRIAGRKGMVEDCTLEELKGMNIGVHQGWKVGFCTPEEVMEAFAGKVTMNIHVKEAGPDGRLFELLRELIQGYHMEQSCYIAARPPMLEWAVKLLPDVPRCALEPWDEQIHILESAQRYGCQRVQFFVGRFQEEDVQQAKERRLICNVFYADDEAACRSYLDMGMDNILTNRYDLLKDLVEGHWG